MSAAEQASLRVVPDLENLLDQMRLQQDKLDRQQTIDAIRQALECGDFVKYVIAENRPPDLMWNGQSWPMGVKPTFNVNVRQTVVYEPFREAERLRGEVARLREALERISSLEPCIHPGGGCFYPIFDGDGNPIGEHDADPLSVITEMSTQANEALRYPYL